MVKKMTAAAKTVVLSVDTKTSSQQNRWVLVLCPGVPRKIKVLSPIKVVKLHVSPTPFMLMRCD